MSLPTPNTPVGLYEPVVIVDGLAHVSGQLPRRNDRLLFEGKVGAELSVKLGSEAAALCAEQCLAILKQTLGDLDRVRRVIKVTGYIASAPGFSEQAQVMNGASQVFIRALGGRGVHARTSVGVSDLPLNAPVEIDLVAAVSPPT